MRRFSIIFLLLLFTACVNEDSFEYLRTDILGNGYYVERYIYCRGGVYAGDSYICFLTDSAGFRKKIDIYDDDEILEYLVEDEKITIVIRPYKIYGFEDVLRKRKFVFKTPKKKT